MEHKVFDHTINQSISFRPFDLKRDFQFVFKWMHESHVIPYWQLNFSKEELLEHMEKAMDDQHQCLYIGLLDGQPMSYFESYWVKGDVVEGSYPAQPFDQGIHLLIGEKDYLGKGLALPLLRAMVSVQFNYLNTQRVIAEPDHRNKKMIHVFEKCGFKQVKPIKLPDKTAMLMCCERDIYEKRWAHVYS